MESQSVGLMAGRERVLSALRREPVDRTPVCNPTSVATVALMDRVGAPFPEANRDAELMARLAETSTEELGFDTVMPVFSVVQESSALGCRIHWADRGNWPTVRMAEPIWRDESDIKIPSDFLRHPDTACVLEAIRLLKERLGDEVAVVGKTMGPWSLSYHLFGVEPFLLMSWDDPSQTAACLDRLKEVTVAFGQAQIDAGADALTLPDHATGDLVSGEYYRRYLFEIHREFAERLSVPLILHICGRTVDRLDDIAQTGMAAFHFESKNDPEEAIGIAAGRIGMIGNINNPEVLLRGGPREVGEAVRGPECRGRPRCTRMRHSARHPSGEPQGDTPGGDRLAPKALTGEKGWTRRIGFRPIVRRTSPTTRIGDLRVPVGFIRST